MQNIKDILQWEFKASDFKYTSDHLFTIDTKKQFNYSVSKLKELIIRLPDGNKLPKATDLIDVYNLFQEKYKGDHRLLSSFFSKRDVRILIWVLDYKPGNSAQVILFSEQFEAAKRIIVEHWKDSFIISLWHVLLKNWITLQSHNEQRTSLINLLTTKSIAYRGDRSSIRNIIRNINLFQNIDAPQKYAVELLRSNTSLDQANNLINQKETVLFYQYYSEVVAEFLKIIQENSITADCILSICRFLSLHNSKKSTLLICSELINNAGFNKVQKNTEIIKMQTVNLISDPVWKTHWTCHDLTEMERNYIETARNKLNLLLNKDFIDVFFEHLVQDDRRKHYWLKFTDEINDIKFVGSKKNYYLLKNIDSISKYVDSRYKLTARNQNTCALIIYAKKFVFVEFTDIGALYIYKKSNFQVNLKSINSMKDLKITPIDQFAYKDWYYPQEEGRITHQGDWESRINSWMKQYYYD